MKSSVDFFLLYLLGHVAFQERFFGPATVFSFQLQKQTRIPFSLDAISTRRIAVWDGSEFKYLHQFLRNNENYMKANIGLLANLEHINTEAPLTREKRSVGFCTIVAGTRIDNGHRVVGILAPNNVASADFVKLDNEAYIYEDSMANIPQKVTDIDAIATLMASIVGVHFVFTISLEKIGGSSDTVSLNMAGRNVIVMGGSEYATFVSDALSLLGAKVSQVTTSSSATRNQVKSVQVVPPATRLGGSDVGFAEKLGSFDALIDTLADEDESDAFDRSLGVSSNDPTHSTSIVLRELKRRHGCHRYVSTLSHAQKIIRDDGILFGRKLVEKYNKDVLDTIVSKASNPDSMIDTFYITPPQSFGPITLQNLLNSNLLYSSNQFKDKTIMRREWSFKDFWEHASWPRDSSGGVNLRFGLPSIDDVGSSFLEEVKNIDGPLGQFSSENIGPIEYESRETSNPFVLEISTLDDLDQQIVLAKKNCIMFLSSSYCRTCKGLTPQYNRMARQTMEEGSKDVVFALADVGKRSTKVLRKVLDVNAVPTFVMFRRGRLYGDKLSISRLPSKRLNLALTYLIDGRVWNSKAFEEVDN